MKRCACGEWRRLLHSGVCYECATSRRTERHHIWGRKNSPDTVEVPGNWHRALDGLRAERCEALKRPGSDPLHKIAAAVATIGEGGEALADFARRCNWPPWAAELASKFAKAAKSAAHWLLMLAGALAEVLGEDWASSLGMPPWQPPEGAS